MPVHLARCSRLSKVAVTPPAGAVELFLETERESNMTRIAALLLTAVFVALGAGCGGEQGTEDSGTTTEPAAQEINYKCSGCGKTLTLASGAPAPSC